MISPLKKRGKKTQQRPQSQLVITPAASLNRDQTLPPLNLLDKEQLIVMDDVLVEKMGAQIENTLEEFGIPARVAGYRIGPTVTQFAIEPGFVERVGTDGEISKHKVRVSQISSLAKDLALALSAERLRIEAPVPGQSYVGIEVPNPQSKMVRLRPILESDAMQRVNSKLALALGQDVSGHAVVADLSKMPHVLIAGTTGSGKSVCVSAITACLLMNNSPQDLRIAMLDPKMVELVRFNGVPHLLGKVETSIDRMVGVMHWAIAEMDQRYRLLEEAKARDLDAYNFKMSRKNQPTLPRIVLIIDELADLMMSSPDQIEHGLVRLAQMARAVGIHLVVATQRPSTDVVTGLIKANFPARIAFTVASSIDSRVILDTGGAETLMGKGDMLYLAPDVGAPQRAQGVMVSDPEIDKIIHYWQNYTVDDVSAEAPWEELMKVMDDDTDDLVKQAIDLVKKSQRASASMLQRRLRIGFPRAARLLDELEEMGIVGPGQGGGKDREVMIETNDDWEDIETEENY
jgi:S-DNA-T family DNA segregation ATPase FtsK/SpoIIIE